MSDQDITQTVSVEIFLVFENETDWSSGRTKFRSAHGSLDDAKAAIPENVRHMEQEPRRDLYGPEFVLDYTYFHIKKQTVNIPASVLTS